MHHAFLYISLPSLHDYNVRVPNFTFCPGYEQKTTTFFIFSLTLIQSFRIQVPKKIAKIWRVKRVGISAIKFANEVGLIHCSVHFRPTSFCIKIKTHVGVGGRRSHKKVISAKTYPLCFSRVGHVASFIYFKPTLKEVNIFCLDNPNRLMMAH